MYIPLLFESRKLRCLIVGGGEVAARKVRVLGSAGVTPTVIAPELAPELAECHTAGAIVHLPREFRSGDCRGFNFVIAASSDSTINVAVASEAHALDIPVNVVDEPSLSTVIFPAVHRDGNLVLAVGTNATAPFMSVIIRNRLASMMEGWSEWLDIAADFRRVVQRQAPPSQSARLLYRLANLFPRPLLAPPKAGESLEVWLKWLERMESNDR